MDKIIKSTLIESAKSTLLVDLVEYKKDSLYVQVNQIIGKGANAHTIKLNPSILGEFISILQAYQYELSNQTIDENHTVVIPTKTIHPLADKIKTYYFKNIPIKDIAMQLGLTTKKVKAILTDSGLEIISHEIPKKKFYRKRWYRSKKK